jgi:hypothetical protein
MDIIYFCVDAVFMTGLTCALLRVNMGLRGMFAGGVIGSGLGYVCVFAFAFFIYFTLL